MELVEVRNASFGYGGKAVVRVEELRLHHGRRLGIFGPNGTGKTTLVRGMTGLLPPMEGTVARRGQIDRGDGRGDLQFGYLPQHRALELHWPMTGFDAAALAISGRGRLGWVGKEDREAVLASLQRLDVAALADRPFATLSGGQQQRLLLAGALASAPHVLVLDEPTDGLDVRSRRRLLDLLNELATAGLCTVIISHEVEDLLLICDDVAWLHPADDPGAASTVEVVGPNTLAERMLLARRREPNPGAIQWPA